VHFLWADGSPIKVDVPVYIPGKAKDTVWFDSAFPQKGNYTITAVFSYDTW
jgi:hypothetical protein